MNERSPVTPKQRAPLSYKCLASDRAFNYARSLLPTQATLKSKTQSSKKSDRLSIQALICSSSVRARDSLPPGDIL